ncbi:unnamed protein product [Prunus armeniaca]
MRQHKLKMNPEKCVFGVQAGNFLGFLVHQRGIEIDKNKAKSIIEALLPRNKKELQRTDLQVGRIAPTSKGRPLKHYVSASEVSIGSLLVQDNKEGKEQVVYYLSRTLTEVERKYFAIERLFLALYFTAMKLRHYMLPYTIYIIAKIDLIKYKLTRPMLRGIIGKCTLALTEYAFRYVPQKAVKGQAVADFLADHPGEEIENMDSLDIANANLLTRAHTCLNNPIYSCTNNRVEYEALIIGLEILVELGIQSVEILGDSMLVLKQIAGEYKCLSPSLAVYLVAARNLLTEFR